MASLTSDRLSHARLGVPWKLLSALRTHYYNQLRQNAQGLAKLVCEHLGGCALSPLALRSQWEVMRARQNAEGTAERLVAVGERRSCSTLRHRLLLFKLLAPLVS